MSKEVILDRATSRNLKFEKVAFCDKTTKYDKDKNPTESFGLSLKISAINTNDIIATISDWDSGGYEDIARLLLSFNKKN
jgi:hypothetical protein